MVDPKLEIAVAQERFSLDEIDIETLEAEIEFWSAVAECASCRAHAGQTLCAYHYERLVYG